MSASVPFTAEQRAAIEHRGGLLLTANAGSGKTSVMAERFVRAVLEDGVDVARILAITFTEKAAAELKERVRRRFEALGEPEKARATEGAWVSTIHGFCARLLRTHPLAAEIDPRFSVLDEHGARAIAEAAFDVALDALVDAHGTAALELIAAYRPADLREAILDLHAELRSRGEDEPRLPAPRPAALEPKRSSLAIARVQAEAELALARDGATVARARLALTECEQLLERVAAQAPGYAPPPGEVARLALPRNGRAFAGEGCEGYRTALQAYVDACADAHAVPVHALLDALLERFGRDYAQAKHDASAVDFEDLELRANRLLREHEELRARYAERFVHVMVDEFQDTNPLQLELLERIAGERLFTVGDELQSIYGFRHADVELFRRRRAALAERGGAATLATNFRSHAAILETLNVAFSPRFGASFVPLVAGRTEDPEALAPDGPRVELLVVDARADWQDAGLLPEGMAAPTPLWRVAEARALAARVRELLDGGRRAGDVVVLLRATGDLAVYERALTDRAIPTYVIGGRGYWSQQQVRDLVAYLGVLANPRDGVALQTLLASPLVGLSSDGLVQVAAAARAARREGEPPDPWWVLTEGRELADRLAPDDAARVLALRAWLPAERAAAPRHSLESLLDRVLARTRYDLELLRLPSGERRLANVRKLMRLAREYEAEEGRDLRGFVDMVVTLGGGLLDTRVQDRESEAPVEGEALDAVRLMTIHRAKGLEFPVVCVADLGRGSPASGDVVRVGKDGSVGVKLRTLDGSAPRPALAYRSIGDARARAEADEEARLFYVAMTRAREQLILSGACPTDPWPQPKPGAPPITWIAPAFVPEIARLAAPDQEPTGIAHNEGMPVAYEVIRPGSPTTIEPEPAQAAAGRAGGARTDGARRQAGAARPQSTGPASGSARPEPHATVQTLSYTALADHARCGYRFYLERILRLPPGEDPAARRGPRTGGLDAATRGVIAHALLEEIDLVRAQPPDAEVVRRAALRTGADPTHAELDEIRGLVVRFLASPLRERLARASDLRREQGFSFALGELPLVGVFDAIASEPPRTLIVDWKSDRLEGGDPEEVVRRSYGLQRAAYALAALRDGAAEVEVVHCFLERPDAPVAATYRQQDAEALEAELLARAERVVRGDFTVAEDPQPRVCDGCPGRGTLCSWPLERTFGVPEGRLL